MSFADKEITEQRQTSNGNIWKEYTCVFKWGRGVPDQIPDEGDFLKPVGVTVPVGDTALKLGPFVAKDGISYGQRKGEAPDTVIIKLIHFNRY